MMRIRVKQDIINPHFLEEWLRFFKTRHYYMSHARGTSGSMVKIDQSIVKDTPILLPSINIQNQILSIIKSIDRTIELEKRIKKYYLSLKNGLMQILLNGIIRVELREDGLHRIKNC